MYRSNVMLVILGKSSANKVPMLISGNMAVYYLLFVLLFLGAVIGKVKNSHRRHFPAECSDCKKNK